MLDLFKKFPLGIYSNSLLDGFKKIIDSYKIKLFLIYVPNRVLQNKAIDLNDQFNAFFFKNTGNFYKEPHHLKMNYFGSLSGILPYFYFLRFLPDQEKALIIYNNLLKILITFFNMNVENQKDAGETNLIKIVGSLISDTSFNLISQTTMESLAELRYVIKDNNLLSHFFLDLVWNTSLITRISDIQLLNDYFMFIRTLYLENTIFFSSHFSIPTLLRIAVIS